MTKPFNILVHKKWRPLSSETVDHFIDPFFRPFLESRYDSDPLPYRIGMLEMHTSLKRKCRLFHHMVERLYDRGSLQ